jgi:outer membrane protein assembly factor BamB
MGGRGTHNEQSLGITIYKGRVYITCGHDYEHGDGPGHLWCLDPTKRGDVSAELVFNLADPKTPVPPRRMTAVDAAAGDYVVPNPDSAVVWHYDQFDQNGDGTITQNEIMHRSMGGVAIQDDILIAVDFSGFVHCLNSDSGRVYWTHDMEAVCWCSPLISGQHAYVCDEDGDVSIFRLPIEPADAPQVNAPVAVIEVRNSIFARPTAADGVLYLNVRRRLYAIAEAQH